MPELENYSVWLIEDTDFQTKLFMAASGNAGITVLKHFSNFTEAKAALENIESEEHKPDAVLIDGNLHLGIQDNLEGKELVRLAKLKGLLTVGFSGTGSVEADIEPDGKITAEKLGIVLKKFFEGN